MTRRSFVHLGAAAGLAAQARGPGTRPNILFLMTDQQRFDCAGIYGNRVIRTPNIDRIGREGAVFRCAYSSTPTCTPARSALLTGLSPWHHGMLGMTNMAQRYPLEKPQALHDAGYYAATIGKQHFHPMRNGHGYDRMILDEHCACGNVHDPQAVVRRAGEDRSDYEAWFFSQAPTLDPHATGLGWNDYPAKAFALPERLHATRWTGDTAVNFLNEYNRKEPFFLKVSFIRPHSPYDPPRRFMEAYREDEMPAPHIGDWAERHAQRGAKHANELWQGDLGIEQARRSRRGYYGSISFIDEQVGRIRAALEKRGQLENTFILFVSDHGDMTGDHHLWRKSYAYESSARVPFFVRPPAAMNLKRGQVRDECVEIRDILPTFLDVAGQKPPAQLDGRSVLPLLRGDAAQWRPWMDLEHHICYSPLNNYSALTDGRSKYIFHAHHGEEQFFDLKEDPGELRDLAKDPAQSKRVREWRERLVKHLAPRGEKFVANGDLVPRPKGLLYSPNYPGKAKA
ncbi:MAG: arylsulfatase [Verrucomicrobia bacterium]|nr:arylsulfatase [Verrucomicrobiota bacterium]